MKNENNSKIGIIINEIMDRRRTKKIIKQIANTNEQMKGIVRYYPSRIEAFFDPSEEIGNYAVSGGDIEWRNQCIVGATIAAYNKQIPVVILHEHNYRLVKQIEYIFSGTGILSEVDKCNRFYDPIWKLSDMETIQLICNVIRQSYEINFNAQYYLSAILKFIRKTGKLPYLHMFMTCPYEQLLDKIDQAVNKGSLKSQEAFDIKTLIMQGQNERGCIENFFNQLRIDSNGKIARKRDLHRIKNIRNTFQENGIIMFDISGPQSTLIDLILEEYQFAANKFSRGLFILDDISISQNKMFENIIFNMGNQKIMISSPDLLSMFNGNLNDFLGFLGKVSKAFILRHGSSYSCEKWSDFIGKYDERSITNTLGNQYTFSKKTGYSYNSSINISVKREYIVKPEQIAALGNNEMFLVDKDKGQKIFTMLILEDRKN